METVAGNRIGDIVRLVPASAHRRWHGMEVRSDALTHQRAISGGVRLADVSATERTLCYESTPLRIHAATDPRCYGSRSPLAPLAPFDRLVR